ncbi:MAG: hypothetical protein NC124_18155, partial [Clostridium sp.]|nr:hypothetical protein [Clostridium sp.]
WCSSGVVSALFHHETIDFTGFFGIFQNVAVADEKYFCHVGFSSLIALICRVLARFARLIFFRKIVKNITDLAKRGKMRYIEAVKRSQNVVKG